MSDDRQLRALLEQMIEAVRNATLALPASPWTEHQSINRYGDQLLLADVAFDKALLAVLRDSGIVATVFSEDSGLHQMGPESAPYVAVIDPLDGSKNFRLGLAHCGPSIALFDRRTGETEGLVVDIATERCWRSDQIDFRPRASTPEPLDVLTVGLPNSDTWRELESVLGQSGSFRALGSSACDLALLASGSCDLFVDLSRTARLVDIAAGTVLVHKAGGTVLTLDGQSLLDEFRSIAASDQSDSVWDRRYSVIASLDSTLCKTAAQHLAVGESLGG